MHGLQLIDKLSITQEYLVGVEKHMQKLNMGMTLFKSIIVLCGTDSILRNMPRIQYECEACIQGDFSGPNSHQEV